MVLTVEPFTSQNYSHAETLIRRGFVNGSHS